jgi:hypothetical protein
MGEVMDGWQVGKQLSIQTTPESASTCEYTYCIFLWLVTEPGQLSYRLEQKGLFNTLFSFDWKALCSHRAETLVQLLTVSLSKNTWLSKT